VEEAMKKVGSKVTVDFGGNQQLKLNSGGVHVGSGADQAIPTSSADQAGPVVLHPPILPKTSITVAGRWGNAQTYTEICVEKFKTDASGLLVKGAANLLETLNSCTKLNVPLRVDEGYYRIFFHRGSGKSNLGGFIFVRISEGENKIIPLREIFVPKYASSTANHTIKFYVGPDNDSRTELEKTMALFFYDYRGYATSNYSNYSGQLDAIWKNISSPSDLVNFCLNETENRKPSFCTFRIDNCYLSSSPAQDGEFISVFPGAYNIEWNIDGQVEFTRGVQVD